MLSHHAIQNLKVVSSQILELVDCDQTEYLTQPCKSRSVRSIDYFAREKS